MWSASEGYPGDFGYRDFYRDIGFDLDFDYIRPHILDGRTRIFTGIKYYRVTGPSEAKEPYDPDRAAEKVQPARPTLPGRTRETANPGRGGHEPPPLVVSPFDAELFGHWWFEGPAFIEALFREAARSHPALTWVTPSDYLDRHPVLQRATPSASSWGWQGYSDCWLSGSNDWIYRHLHDAAGRMPEIARDNAERRPGHRPTRASASGAFAVACAGLRLGIHHENRHRRGLCLQPDPRPPRPVPLSGGRGDRRYDRRTTLQALETMDNIFPEIDYRVFA